MFQPLFLLWRGKRVSSIGAAVLAAVLALGVLVAPAAGPAAAAPTKTYSNPLTITIPGGGRVESCADPTVLSAQVTGDGFWYAYCTTDPLNDADQTGGNFNFHLIPMLRSADLVNWTYMGDAFSAKPSWVAPNAGLWAPEIQLLQRPILAVLHRVGHQPAGRRQRHRRRHRLHRHSGRGRTPARRWSSRMRPTAAPVAGAGYTTPTW